MRLRDAGVSYVGAVAELQTRCWCEAYRGRVPQSYLDRVTVADREFRWRERSVSGARGVGLAETGGLLVGVVCWGVTDVPGMPERELKSLYVDRDHRGTGVAAALLHRAVREDPAHLWVFQDNPRARAFYVKHGFAPDEHRGRSIATPGWSSGGPFTVDRHPARRTASGKPRVAAHGPLRSSRDPRP